MSRELILSMTVSVDGFVCGPNGEIDWIFRTMSEEGREWLIGRMWQVGLIAMGHRSYQDMVDYWPTAGNPIAPPMNQIPKAVFSRSGAITPPTMAKTTASLEADPSERTSAVRSALESWLHPTVTGTDLIADLQRLKAEDGKPISVLGGASFAASVIATNLVDVFTLIVHPIALGRGIPMFGGLEAPLLLTLEDVQQFKSGVVAKTYRPCQ